MIKSKLYRQLYDGDSIELNPQKNILNFACCDCGLVHNIKFTVNHRQKMRMTLKRDNRRTGRMRRRITKK